MTPSPAAEPVATQMLTEARSAPAAIAHLLAQDADRYAAVSECLRRRPDAGLLTLARGSSDHAAQHLAYLVMARLGRLVTSLPMSVLTLYGSKLRADALVSFAFSQSGQSPDLVEPTRALRAGGATTVALVNDSSSPLAAAAEHLLPLHAGPERSVAATKSCIAQLVAGARLVAAWQGDAALAAAVAALPEALQRATALDWSAAIEPLREAGAMFVVARGPALAVAQEMALKFKETCGLQAEAFSGAELQHGPMALVGQGYPVLVLAPRGPAQAGMVALAAQLAARGAHVLLAVPPAAAAALGSTLPTGPRMPVLPLATTGHEDLDAITALQSFYPLVEALARARGLDPDQPRFLSKVTKTR
jgi:glutamine---fructose-6-phosphate transaminase (isomerizing)